MSSTVIDITSHRQACEEMVADDNHTWNLADFARVLPLEKAQFAEFGSHEGICSGNFFQTDLNCRCKNSPRRGSR